MTRRRWQHRLARERGSAVVDFTLVGVLLIGMFLALFQVGLALHVRNTLVACAADGARYGANADRTPADGAEHTRGRIRAALPDRFAQDVAGDYEVVDGVPTVVVEVRAEIPVIGFLGPPRSLVVRGHALAESP